VPRHACIDRRAEPAARRFLSIERRPIERPVLFLFLRERE
jgi:hypothetical protein